MSTHVDPVPYEARPFQGRRAGLATRAAAAVIDVAPPAEQPAEPAEPVKPAA